jgi:hypothetical protein
MVHSCEGRLALLGELEQREAILWAVIPAYAGIHPLSHLSKPLDPAIL